MPLPPPVGRIERPCRSISMSFEEFDELRLAPLAARKDTASG